MFQFLSSIDIREIRDWGFGILDPGRGSCRSRIANHE